MNVVALLLADSRFPGGGHAHSGGLEEAAARHLVSTVDSLASFLRSRLYTTGFLAAVFAAAAAHAARRGAGTDFWSRLDAELDARTPSPAARETSRSQGRATLRALAADSRALAAAPTSIAPPALTSIPTPAPTLTSIPTPASTSTSTKANIYDKCQMGTTRPHHALVLGQAVGLAGGLPEDAALTAAYLSVSGPASAAVRLLGLDPLAVHRILAELAEPLRELAGRAAATAGFDPAELPAPGAPGLDLLAEAHDRKHHEEVRLFAS